MYADRHAPSILYRFYDADDRLLYVGVTYNLSARKSQHRKGKKWFCDVARIETQEFPMRFDAELEELRVMKEECPLYNIHGLKRRSALERKGLSMDAAYEFMVRGLPYPKGYTYCGGRHQC